MNQKLYQLPGEDFWRITTSDRASIPISAEAVVDFVPPEKTTVYHWLIASNGGLWRMTNRRYATREEVLRACPVPVNCIMYPLEQTKLDLYDYDPPAADFTEGDRQIRHSGGCQGENM
jgi:hypothetical protein